VSGRKSYAKIVTNNRDAHGTLKDPPLFAILKGIPVERVKTFKLLGVHVTNDLKWMQHVDAISSKVSPRLYFLKQLKRSGAGPMGGPAVFLRHSDRYVQC